MKLKFTITYGTAWGEELHVVLTYYDHEGSAKCHNLLMTTDDGCHWTAETVVMESRHRPISRFEYIYQVEDRDGLVLRREWGDIPRVYSFDSTKNYNFPDAWRDIPVQSHLYTNAYLTTVHAALGEEVMPLDLPLFRRTILFRVSAPQLRAGQTLAVCGSHPSIGGWNVSRYVPMHYAGRSVWMLTLNVMGMLLPLDYKYVIVDDSTGTIAMWEEGDNRVTADDRVADGEVLVLDGGVLRVREDMWRVAGVVVPVFSLRSRCSYGAGDFGDLRRMVDWAVATGMRVIQTLPVNDTTKTHDWADSYPYNAISIYALHPHYIDLDAAGHLSDAGRMNAYNRQRRELNALTYSDYEAVDRVKTAYLRELYAEQGKETTSSDGFCRFIAANTHWLRPYAAFCLLRDTHGTAHFQDWPEYSVYNSDAIDRYCVEHADDITFIYYVQYLLHVQLLAAADYARSKGVVLKGDIPIGICRDSVEAWMQPALFHLDAQTGAPPDVFSLNGQNWGFPTYNWDAMTADGCRWWRNRFACMEQYFDAFRIDHVLGFFRIWEIPDNAVNGLLGHFSPALPLTAGEVEYFGLQFRKDFMTCPFINDKIIERIFGIHARYVRDTFLDAKAYNLYDLKSEYNTQRKVEVFFRGRRDENSLWIRDGLYRLISNVLFVEDPRREGMYHPRICAYNEPVFDVLCTEEKDAFMRLYNNYYYQRHDMFWGSHAMRLLSQIIEGTRMMVCAEDLGMLPACVEHVLDALRIQTLEIQTMPKQSGTEYAHLEAYPYRSVATFATHDMPPMRLWWYESPERAQRYYVTMLQKEGQAPEHLPAHLAEEIIARHLYCPSMLCLLSIQDWLAMDSVLRHTNPREERINVPSDSYNKWKYRMHINIEDLLAADRYNKKIKTMITRSKR